MSQISGTSLAGKCSRKYKELVISFSETEMKHITCTHEDTLVITAEIDVYVVKRVLIDSGNSTDVRFLEALKKMVRSDKDLNKIIFH